MLVLSQFGMQKITTEYDKHPGSDHPQCQNGHRKVGLA